MAYISATPAVGKSFTTRVMSLLDRLGNALVAMAEARSDVREIRALQSLSDEALAARGLKRDEIVQTVLGARYYL
jgi:uncharacterized protein YjiS (DUF1127 family)